MNRVVMKLPPKSIILLFQRGNHSMRHLYRPSSILHESQRSSNGKSNSDTAHGSKSLRLMLDLGLIQPSSTGTFNLLPIALKSMDKLTKIIEHFMGTIGAQKLQLPTLTASSLWAKTGRLAECDGELMKVTDRQSREYVLSPTHEEAVCDLLSCSKLSYKQLPIRLYQITSKFRDELRPKYGLLRSREFVMKDLYTFDKDKETALATYDEVNTAYEAIFDYIGVKWLKVRGTAGAIGGDITHEFHFLSNAGEDKVLVCAGCSDMFNSELAIDHSDEIEVEQGSLKSTQFSSMSCPNCGSRELTSHSAIEVGHSFLLGTKYTKPLKTTFMNFNGKSQFIEMGCYGIGVSRILASVIEVLSTNTEIKWPLPIAPYQFAIIPPKSGSKEEKHGEELSNELITYFAKILPNDVILDDRSEFTIGRRFIDLKMLGIRYIIILGKRLTENPRVIELHDVYDGTVTDLTQGEILKYCYNLKSKWNLL